MREVFHFVEPVIVGLLFLYVGIFGFIMPSIRCAKKILRHRKDNEVLPVRPVERVAFIVMPVLGYFFLSLLKEDAELLDWKYIMAIWIPTAISFCFYFFSRTRKHKTSPLLLALIPSALTIGILLTVFQFIHFSPFIITETWIAFFLFPLTLFLFPVFSLIQVVILLSAELYSVLQLTKDKALNSYKEEDLVKSRFTDKLLSFYFGKNYVIAQIITFPVFVTVVQFILVLFSQKPDSIIQAFIESSDGIFSQGRNDNYVPPPPTTEYICTIASYGSSALVKPIHLGYRQGGVIRVTRQLKVCNAFEEMLSEKMPRTQLFLRKMYDGLQIRIDKWKTAKVVCNTLYILIKPMEWTFLAILYLVDEKPETRIAKQYMPLNFQQPKSRSEQDEIF